MYRCPPFKASTKCLTNILEQTNRGTRKLLSWFTEDLWCLGPYHITVTLINKSNPLIAQTYFKYRINLKYSDTLTLVLLNLDKSCLCKQCRSRSAGFFRSQLIWICTVCHSVSEFISTLWIKYSDWQKIRNGCGILIYSARQGLTAYYILSKTLNKFIYNLFLFPKLARQAANSVDPDQMQHSGSTQFAQAYLMSLY